MNDQDIIDNLDLLLDFDVVKDSQDLEILEDLDNVEKLKEEDEDEK